MDMPTLYSSDAGIKGELGFLKADGSPIVTVSPDGRVTLGEHLTLEDMRDMPTRELLTVRAFIDAALDGR